MSKTFDEELKKLVDTALVLTAAGPHQQMAEDIVDLVKTLIKKHQPERVSEDEINIANTLINHTPEDMLEGHTHKDSLNLSKGYNQALKDSDKAYGLSDE